MIIDVLVAGNSRHREIIQNCLEAESDRLGTGRGADREALIWMQRQCHSKLGQDDIEKLSRAPD